MDPRIRIHPKMSWIRNTGQIYGYKKRQFFPLSSFVVVVVVGSRIRDPGWEKSGSGINIPDLQHCYSSTEYSLQAIKQFHEVLCVGQPSLQKSRTQISSDASCAELRFKVSGWQPYDVLPAAFSRVSNPKLAGSLASGRLLLKSLGPKKDEKLGDLVASLRQSGTRKLFWASSWTRASCRTRASCPLAEEA